MDEQVDNSPASRATEGGARLRYIDALRGIAALLVLWLHVANCYRALSPETAAHVRWLNDFVSTIDIGRIGVVVFFLISGFVIPFSIRRDSGAPVVSFAIRRLFRIYPAYWLSLPLAAYVFYWMVGRPFTAGEFLVNTTMLQQVFGVRHAEPVYWTLLVEIAFYALCILLLLGRSLYSARRVALLSGTLAALHLFGVSMMWFNRPVFTVAASFLMLNLSVMLWGTLYRFALDRHDDDRLARFAFWGLGMFYLVVLPLGASIAGKPLPNYTVSYALAFLVFIGGTRFLRIETRLTDWLGRISYSIYLFHPIVFQPIYLWLLTQPTGSTWRTQHLAVYLIVNLALTLAAAALVFRFVERPMIRLGHRLAARYEQRASRPRIAERDTSQASDIAAGAAAG